LIKEIRCTTSPPSRGLRQYQGAVFAFAKCTAQLLIVKDGKEALSQAYSGQVAKRSSNRKRIMDLIIKPALRDF
jgi:hypothetical protein